VKGMDGAIDYSSSVGERMNEAALIILSVFFF
jgi:hypothetical protein